VKLGLKRSRTEQAAAKAPKNPNGELLLALTEEMEDGTGSSEGTEESEWELLLGVDRIGME
jgi:hypothetical protein